MHMGIKNFHKEYKTKDDSTKMDRNLTKKRNNLFFLPIPFYDGPRQSDAAVNDRF
jgi:hypothetical protein